MVEESKVMNRWFVVVGALLIQLCLGAIYAWGAFTTALQAPEGEFKFSAAQTSWIFSAGLASFALVMILAGRLQDKYGPRIIAIIGGLVLGAGYITASFTGTSFPLMLVFIGIVGGAGIGMGYVCPIAACVKWFPDLKGLITGLAVAGFGAGAFIFVKLAGSWVGLIDSQGVNGTFLIFGIIVSLWMMYKNFKDGPSKSGKFKNYFQHVLFLFFFVLIVFVSSNTLTNLTRSWRNSGIMLEMLSRVFSSLLRTRSLSILWIIVPIMASIGFDAVLEALCKHLNKKMSYVVICVMILSVTLFSFNQLFIAAEKNVRTTNHVYHKQNYEEFIRSLKWLKENANENSVVLIDINWERLKNIGTISIDSLINLESGMRTINGNQIEASQLNTRYLNDMKFEDTEKERRELHKFGVDYVFSYENPEYDAPYLEKVYSDRIVDIYEVIDIEGPYRTIEYSLGRNLFHMKMDVLTGGEIEIPLQYNNHWNAYVNGESKKTERGESGLIELKLDSGINDISLTFKRTFIESISLLMSIFTVGFCILYIFHHNR